MASGEGKHDIIVNCAMCFSVLIGLTFRRQQMHQLKKKLSREYDTFFKTLFLRPTMILYTILFCFFIFIWHLVFVSTFLKHHHKTTQVGKKKMTLGKNIFQIVWKFCGFSLQIKLHVFLIYSSLRTSQKISNC